jgi:hypothetical protein
MGKQKIGRPAPGQRALEQNQVHLLFHGLLNLGFVVSPEAGQDVVDDVRRGGAIAEQKAHIGEELLVVGRDAQRSALLFTGRHEQPGQVQLAGFARH